MAVAVDGAACGDEQTERRGVLPTVLVHQSFLVNCHRLSWKLFWSQHLHLYLSKRKLIQYIKLSITRCCCDLVSVCLVSYAHSFKAQS